MRAHLAAGRERVAAKQYSEALVLLRRAIALDRTALDAHYHLANVRAVVGMEDLPYDTCDRHDKRPVPA